jgi:hypothetical protein
MTENWQMVSTDAIIHAAFLTGRFGHLLTTKQVAEKLNISVHVLYRSNSGPPYIQPSGKRPRYPAELIASKDMNPYDLVKALLGQGVRDDLTAWLEKANWTPTMVFAMQVSNDL